MADGMGGLMRQLGKKQWQRKEAWIAGLEQHKNLQTYDIAANT